MNGNIQFKELFLEHVENNYGKQALDDYNTLFGDNRIGFWENIYSKDVYDFTKEELLNAYAGLGSSKLSSLRSSHSLLNKYVMFAFEHKKSIFPSPVTQDVNTEDLKRCLNKRKMYEKYITNLEFDKMIQQFRNSQDRALYIIIYKLGIIGKELSDIINLKEDQFNYEEGYIKFNEKFYYLSDVEKEIIQDSITEEIYDNYTSLSMRHSSPRLVKSEYIIKPAITRASKVSDWDKITPIALRARIKKIAKEFGFYHLSPTTLYASGIANKMLDIKDELWNYTEVADYVKKNDLSLNAFDLRDTLLTIKEKRENERL